VFGGDDGLGVGQRERLGEHLGVGLAGGAGQAVAQSLGDRVETAAMPADQQLGLFLQGFERGHGREC
jgi:hypothetical protein